MLYCDDLAPIDIADVRKNRVNHFGKGRNRISYSLKQPEPRDDLRPDRSGPKPLDRAETILDFAFNGCEHR